MSDVQLVWRKSSHSAVDGNCVEWAPAEGGGVLVRDSKNPAGARLSFTAGEWSAFVAGVRSGEADI